MLTIALQKRIYAILTNYPNHKCVIHWKILKTPEAWGFSLTNLTKNFVHWIFPHLQVCLNVLKINYRNYFACLTYFLCVFCIFFCLSSSLLEKKNIKVNIERHLWWNTYNYLLLYCQIVYIFILQTPEIFDFFFVHVFHPLNWEILFRYRVEWGSNLKLIRWSSSFDGN